VIEPPDGFLAGVCSAARRAGVLFVLDEVLTFRLSESGGQGRAGVEADLTMFGKLIGGGFPCGAIGGRADIMAVLDPRSASFHHSGTFNGNLITTLAGSIAISHLTADRIEGMEEGATHLRRAIVESAETRGVPCTVTQEGSLMNIFLSDHIPLASAVRQDSTEIAALHLACLNHGVFLAKRGMIAMSTALNDSILDEACAGIDAAIADVGAAFY
jgi:glutamate-1-semialdehyde 2,1-aminomutase